MKLKKKSKNVKEVFVNETGANLANMYPHKIQANGTEGQNLYFYSKMYLNLILNQVKIFYKIFHDENWSKISKYPPTT